MKNKIQNKRIANKAKKTIQDTKKGKPARIIVSVLLLMVWVFSSIIASQLIVGYLMLWILGADKFSQPVWTSIYSAVTYTVAMLLIILVPRIILSKKKAPNAQGKTEKPKQARIDRTELGLRGSPTWTDIGLAPIAFIVYLLLAAILVSIFNLFPWFDAEQTQQVGFSTYIVGFDKIVAFITLVVVAPIAEEIIFRGWLYGKIRRRFNAVVDERASVFLSIFLVSLLFGIVHLQWNVGVNVFAMSVVACGLREITGTIYSGILLHMVKNGVAFYLLYVLGI